MTADKQDDSALSEKDVDTIFDKIALTVIDSNENVCSLTEIARPALEICNMALGSNVSNMLAFVDEAEAEANTRIALFTSFLSKEGAALLNSAKTEPVETEEQEDAAADGIGYIDDLEEMVEVCNGIIDLLIDLVHLVAEDEGVLTPDTVKWLDGLQAMAREGVAEQLSGGDAPTEE